VARPGLSTVAIAGRIGARPDGELVGPDAESQTRQVLANLVSVLVAARGGPQHLLRLFAMVAGREHLPGYRAGRGPGAGLTPRRSGHRTACSSVTASQGPLYQ
jgi:enamine deaminase RidA (YjgF/YER057c/UK114 family)